MLKFRLDKSMKRKKSPENEWDKVYTVRVEAEQNVEKGISKLGAYSSSVDTEDQKASGEKDTVEDKKELQSDYNTDVTERERYLNENITGAERGKNKEEMKRVLSKLEKLKTEEVFDKQRSFDKIENETTIKGTMYNIVNHQRRLKDSLSKIKLKNGHKKRAKYEKKQKLPIVKSDIAVEMATSRKEEFGSGTAKLELCIADYKGKSVIPKLPEINSQRVEKQDLETLKDEKLSERGSKSKRQIGKDEPDLLWDVSDDWMVRKFGSLSLKQDNFLYLF